MRLLVSSRLPSSPPCELWDVSLSSGFDIEGLPTAVWPGGESEALTRIERHLERKVSTAGGGLVAF